MSSTKSTVTRIASSRTRPEQSPRAAVRPLIEGDFLSLAFMNTANSGMLDRFNERYRSDSVDIITKGSSELGVFYEFLAHHVQPSRTCDVQCMRLWSEWVRTFQRRTNRFPEQVLEKEFRSAVTDLFGVAVAEDGFWGTIFSRPAVRAVTFIMRDEHPGCRVIREERAVFIGQGREEP